MELVEVTAHGGARPEHAKWQGKVFSRHGDKEIDGVKYKDLRKATGYGSGAGLCGWNCRHNFHPYVPGTSRTWSDKELAKLDEKNIEYNGVKMTEYEASQAQRKIEREIRKQKRTVAALEVAGEDASEYRAKLRNAQKSYTDFTEQTGLKKQQARTQTGAVTDTNKAEVNRIVEKRREQAAVAAAKTTKNSGQSSVNLPIENNAQSGKMSVEETTPEKAPEPQHDTDFTVDSEEALKKAKSGARHGGVYKDAVKKRKAGLKKSIASREAQVEEHKKKLANPEKYDAGWADKTEQERQGLLRKWRKDIQRNAEQAAIEKEVYKERFGEDNE